MMILTHLSPQLQMVGGLPNGNSSLLPPVVQSEPNSFINCLLLNVRSIVHKLPDLNYLLTASNPGLLCLTETWLNPSITDSVVRSSHNHSIFRKDRISSTHDGSVCILINNECFKATQVSIRSIRSLRNGCN